MVNTQNDLLCQLYKKTWHENSKLRNVKNIYISSWPDSMMGEMFKHRH